MASPYIFIPAVRRVYLGVVSWYPNSLTLGLPSCLYDNKQNYEEELWIFWYQDVLLEMHKVKLIMWERTTFLTSLLWMHCISWSDGKNYAKTRTINESYCQYVNINAHLSCFIIIAVQENITICVMLNCFCKEPCFVTNFLYMNVLVDLMSLHSSRFI